MNLSHILGKLNIFARSKILSVHLSAPVGAQSIIFIYINIIPVFLEKSRQFYLLDNLRLNHLNVLTSSLFTQYSTTLLLADSI